MANVYHLNYISQLLKEQQNVIKENIMATIKKWVLNFSEEKNGL